MLSSPGIGSGLDVIGIVSQFIAVEKNSSLASHETRQQAQPSAFGSLKGALSTLQASAPGIDEFNEALAASLEGIRTLFTGSFAPCLEQWHAYQGYRQATGNKLAATCKTRKCAFARSSRLVAMIDMHKPRLAMFCNSNSLICPS